MDYLVPPDLVGKQWWDIVSCPSTMAHQYFGFELHDDDFVNADEFFKRQSEIISGHNRDQFQPWEDNVLSVDTGYSKVKNNSEEFEVTLTIKPFNQANIKVSCAKGYLIIQGEHSIIEEGSGEVSRKFERQYVLPKYCDPKTLKYDVSNDILVARCEKTQWSPETPSGDSEMTD